ncbi:hypothetical protein KAI12_05275, partial [Candidatus Bathyarchaeota archaeon]|nr:hypothetical protein [Candidatus Bathyarchaeota archaeon]
YNLDVSLQEKSGRWKFISLNTLSEPLKEVIIREMKKNRSVVLDSISELLLEYNSKEIFELISAMNTQNNETKELHFILLTKGMQDPKTEIAMQYFADGVLDFEASWKTEGLTQSLTIRNMSGVIVPTHRLPYSLGKRGFTIETATRIT